MRVALCLLLLALAAGAQDLNYEIYRLERRIDATYQQRGWRHTAPDLTGLDAGTSGYLTQLLHLLDVAVAARAEAEAVLGQKLAPGHYDKASEVIAQRLADLKPPASLQAGHRLILSSLDDERSYFYSWALKPGSPIDPYDDRVRSCHRDLERAYDLLLAGLPPDSERLDQAIYDRLHALDLNY